MSKKYMQGRYKVINKHKYIGDVNNVIYRSSWELKYLHLLDKSDDILEFSSEETIIPYQDHEGKIRRYFVDFKIKDKNGNISLVEIKPYKETTPPILSEGKKTKTKINEILTYDKNQKKWKAARKFCDKMGWKFLIITEKELYGS